MRTLKTSDGVDTFVNNNEWHFIQKQPEVFNRSDLNDNEKYMASQLCRRGVLIAKKTDVDIVYKLHTNRLQ